MIWKWYILHMLVVCVLNHDFWYCFFYTKWKTLNCLGPQQTHQMRTLSSVYICVLMFSAVYIYDIVIKLKHVKLKTEFRSTNDVCYQTTARATTTSWRAPRRTAARAWIRPPSVTASWTVPAASTRSIAVRPAYYRTVMVSECLMKIIFIC